MLDRYIAARPVSSKPWFSPAASRVFLPCLERSRQSRNSTEPSSYVTCFLSPNRLAFPLFQLVTLSYAHTTFNSQCRGLHAGVHRLFIASEALHLSFSKCRGKLPELLAVLRAQCCSFKPDGSSNHLRTMRAGPTRERLLTHKRGNVTCDLHSRLRKVTPPIVSRSLFYHDDGGTCAM